MTGEGGESWERPTSNNGPIKAERKKVHLSNLNFKKFL